MEDTQEKKDTGLPFGDGSSLEGVIHISEDVIVELTRKTIAGIPHIQIVSTRLGSKFAIGRKGGDGIRVSVEEGEVPSIILDAYVLVKYGQRIPDLAWDVQEKVKTNLERYTGYTVKTVNINVQGIYVDDPISLPEGTENSEEASDVPAIAPEAGVEDGEDGENEA